MIKLSLFLFSGLTLIFGILFFKNLHREEIFIATDREKNSRENNEEGGKFGDKKAKKVSQSFVASVILDNVPSIDIPFLFTRNFKSEFVFRVQEAHK